MKIKLEHYEHLAGEISKTVSTLDMDEIKKNIETDPRVKNLGMRLRWDILWLSVSSRWICDNLYPYMNDDHIDTALRAIAKEQGWGL